MMTPLFSQVIQQNQILTRDQMLKDFLQGSSVFIPYAIATFLIVASINRALSSIDMNWDVTAYHLPFIALRAGLMSADEFRLPHHLLSYYEGFPPLPDYIRAAFWLFSGKIESTNLLNIVSVLILLLYLAVRWRLSPAWACLALFAVPAMQTSIASAYTDVFANVLLLITILCICEAWIDFRRLRSVWFWIILFFSAFGSANSKLQITVLVGIALVFLVYPMYRCAKLSVISGSGYIAWALGIFVALCAIFSNSIINFVQHGNPIYPVQMNIGPFFFPGPHIGGDLHFPKYLANTPQPIRWLLSVIEYRALELRPTTYTVGMGDVQEGLPSARMGGFFGMLSVYSFLLFTYLVYTTRTWKAFVLAVFFACLTFFVSIFPASYESRYYLVWMIYLIVAISIIISDEKLRAIQTQFRLVCLASLVFVISVTGGFYLRSSDAAAAMQVYYHDFLVENVQAGDVFCAEQNQRFAVLASPVLQRGIAQERPYSIQLDACDSGAKELPAP